MLVPIIFPTALEFWLNGACKPDHYAFLKRESLPYDFDFRINKQLIVQIIKTCDFQKPIHIMASSSSRRSHAKSVHCVARPVKIPPNSFICFNSYDNFYIAVPEYCFLQAAVTYPLHKLVQLANNLCAIYTLDPDYQFGQRKCSPITSTDVLLSYLKKCDNIAGYRQALRGLKYAVDCSNSPMESSLATIAVLPFNAGGYGIPKPIMNARVSLSGQGIKLLRRDECMCDMVWPKEKVIIEYDSNLTHLSREQHAIDKQRATALVLSGYKVISITAKQICDVDAMDNVFQSVRYSLGMKKSASLFAKYRCVREEIFRDLFRSKIDQSTMPDYFTNADNY